MYSCMKSIISASPPLIVRRILFPFIHPLIPTPYTKDSSRPNIKRPRSAPPSASNFSPAILTRDAACLLTEAADYLHAAHLCPRSQASWFKWNNMSRYNRNTALASEWVTDDIANGFALRPDIPMAFDDKKFAAVPKEGGWVAHFFGITNELGSLHHNQSLDIPQEVSYAFLLTRLAWIIFPLVAGFLESGPDRVLTAHIMNDGRMREETRWYSAWELPMLDLSPKRGSESPTKSRSPQKRKARSGADAGDVPRDEPAKRQRLAEEDYEEQNYLGARDLKDVAVQVVPETPPSSSPAKPWDIQSCSPDSECSLPSFNSLDFAQTQIRDNDSQLVRKTKEHNKQIQILKETWLRLHRPQDTTLYCCNYHRAERDAQRGLAGDARKGGAYLYHKCLGFERPNQLLGGLTARLLWFQRTPAMLERARVPFQDP